LHSANNRSFRQFSRFKYIHCPRVFVDLVQKKTVIYHRFVVQNETNHYRLTVGNYDFNISSADDVLSQANGQGFTTEDRDHDNEADRNCAEELRGGFWYSLCDPDLAPVLGITASNEDFRWGNDSLQRARMYLTCSPK